MKSFALSRLAKQRLLLGDKFVEHFAHDWLVWEPGAWIVPKGVAAGSETVPPKAGVKKNDKVDDPVCFVLAPRLDGSACSIGRAEGNDLVLSDETVSRNHCFFSHTGDTWVVSCTPEARELQVGQKKVKASESAPIRAGEQLALGHIVLTLLDPSRMVERIDSMPISKV